MELSVGLRTVWAIVLLVLAPAVRLTEAQGSSVWTVRPEWVKAHEDFLASDVLAGRGSATRDEQLAATYVASEFEGYGLKPAPGMTGYLQSANVDMPMLDGHSRLDVSGTSLNEGSDYELLMSPAVSAEGPLLRLSVNETASIHVDRGAAVLLAGAGDPDAAWRAISDLRHAGAAIVLLSTSPAMMNLYAQMGSHTRTPSRLAGDRGPRASATVVLLKPEAFSRLAGMAVGSAVSVKVNRVQESAPRLTYNALGYLPGSDPDAGTILLTAHLDHLGVGQPVNGDAIYNGANDDAAGTTAVLELARALAAGPRLRRNILFVCYGSEEVGELGSTYFGEHPPVPLKSLIANLEFEMIGNQDPKMPKGVLLLTGWERSNLGPELRAHGALLGPDPYPEQHFFERSDNYSLALRGVVAHTAAGFGTVATYHQPDDDVAHLDLPFMTSAIQSLVEPMRWLASSSFVPRWNPGGQPKGR
ncbi:MAG TPA: M28 family peptidase [Acidobacteriaceae bacterium]|nr:M28 family peptidase [Acidobacteriaceae bacterium]